MKRNTQRILIYGAAAVIVIGALTALVMFIYNTISEKFAESEQVMELEDYYHVADNEAMIILDDKIYEKKAFVSDNKPYLDMESVITMYNHRYFWSSEENLLIYTTPTEVISFTPGKEEYLVNDEKRMSEQPVIAVNNSTVYILMDYLVKANGLTYSYYEDPNRVMISYEDIDYLYSDVTEETSIRTENDKKSDILKVMQPGDRLMYIDGGGIQVNGYVKVMSEDGVRGYIKTDSISDSYYGRQTFTEYIPEKYTHLLYSDKIYLAWQLLYTSDSVDMLKSAVKDKEYLNTVAPTWFFLSGTKGDMVDYANQEYVDTAHELGLKVWGTYKNDVIEGEFSGQEDTHTLLTSTASRKKLIKGIIQSADKYDLDGINIDFEALKMETGVYFIEFLRELSVSCRNEGYVLSVDNYVPENYNAFYDIAEQAKIVDYVVIMGYDQHTGGSDETGSVSALDWFTTAIDLTLEKASPEQVIMAVPFYTRLWKETVKDGKTAIGVEATLSMAECEKKAKDSGAKLEWKKSAGQYYIEYDKGGSTYKMWLEEEESIAAKTDAIREAELAGVAAWKLGDGKKGIWTIIGEHMNGITAEEEDSLAE